VFGSRRPLGRHRVARTRVAASAGKTKRWAAAVVTKFLHQQAPGPKGSVEIRVLGSRPTFAGARRRRSVE